MGGLLTDGFPSYRLPKKVVEKDLSIIEKMGIEVHLGKTRWKGYLYRRRSFQSFDAVFIATGVSGTDSMVQAFKGLEENPMGNDSGPSRLP